MSTQFHGKPDKFRPAFNPLYWYLSSDHYADEGFKYIFDIFPQGDTTNRLARLKLFPRPDDSYGEADISTVLSSQLSSFLNQHLHSFSECPTNFYQYDIYVGEEYVHYWPFTINYDASGQLALSGNSQTHKFVAGDEVLVTFTTANATHDGVHTVSSVPSTNAIVINDTFYSGGSGGLYTGTAVYSNKRKTMFTGQTGTTGYTVFIGAVGFRDIDEWTSSTYNLTTITGSTNTKKFLTNVPENFTVRPENSMWLNFYSTSMPSNAPTLEVNTGGASIYFPNPVYTSTDPMLTVAVGVNDIKHFATSATCYDYNHTNMSGAVSTFFTCETEYYSARTVNDLTAASIDSGGTVTWGTPDFRPSSEWKVFKINNNTISRFTNVELYFMDRLGSIIPWNFEFQSSRSIEKNSSQFKAIMGDLSSNRWRTESTDAGTKQINTVVVEQLTVTTGWLTESESTYFAELLTSPVVYIKEYGKLWPVIVKTSGLPILTKANRKMINQTILIEYAVNNPIQNL